MSCVKKYSIVIINLTFNLIFSERLEKIDKILLLDKKEFRSEINPILQTSDLEIREGPLTGTEVVMADADFVSRGYSRISHVTELEMVVLSHRHRVVTRFPYQYHTLTVSSMNHTTKETLGHGSA